MIDIDKIIDDYVGGGEHGGGGEDIELVYHVYGATRAHSTNMLDVILASHPTSNSAAITAFSVDEVCQIVQKLSDDPFVNRIDIHIYFTGEGTLLPLHPPEDSTYYKLRKKAVELRKKLLSIHKVGPCKVFG